MAGIYIHIPFCIQRCSYCNFFSVVSINLVNEVINAIIKELSIRKDYLKNEPVQTIYFGGGTPSLLTIQQIEKLLNTVYTNFPVEQNAEITFEANPDDLTKNYLFDLKEVGINRLSIGIQSFDDDKLKILNRRHNATQAHEAVREAQKAGFSNISIDLIYGLPFQSLDEWETDLDKAFSLSIQHLSAYGLTFEEKTLLSKQKEKKIIEPADEELMIKMYELLLEESSKKGFDAYEISNFSLPGFYSRHNSSYWNQTPYLGVGPSAHSYNGISRQWNVAAIQKYTEGILKNSSFYEQEILSLEDRYNEYVLLGLRTKNGINIDALEQNFGTELKDFCLENIKTFIDNEKAYRCGSFLRLNTKGKLISDTIIAQLMKV
ncbi:MAG TPA: radical SAM family heme chaperone HemW [Paludibacteraceae bacterium]|jgi:oxygen-independent coproporphyrinogen-3 oxidase|nr:radical SAM family heme chaperone HemW [Paludibacteraceae bacterium]HPL77027.1 radical SAM family heme chaperone HemW [Paludibacteraceae bacterium]HPQ13074.1 radical SAM family heme chaperone HemW [Paludibacteraceae bacterium]